VAAADVSEVGNQETARMNRGIRWAGAGSAEGLNKCGSAAQCRTLSPTTDPASGLSRR
jgi:hypothetical protein